MRRLAAALALTGAAPAPVPAPAPIDRVIAAAHFDGAVVAGRADRPAIVRGPARAVWRWASVTKQLTALIAMQEVAAGRLDLDQPVAAYWPEWPQVFADLVTVRDLMRHTSGLADPNEDGPNRADGMPFFYVPPAGHGTMGESATGYCAEHPRAKPGVTFHYDNCDYLVLGALLERTTGKPFATLLRERIAAPLHLRIGLFAPDRPPARHVGGLDEKGRPDQLGNLGVYGAAGSAYGTPLALYAFDRALLAHRLLPPAVTEQMWAGDARFGQAALGVWEYRATLPGCAAPVRVVERRGQIGGVQARNFLLPDSGAALVLFTRHQAFRFGEVWRHEGFAWRALAAIGCPP